MDLTALRERLQEVVARFQGSRPGRALARYSKANGSLMVGGIAYTGLFSVFAALAIGVSVLMAVVGRHPQLRQAVLDAVDAALPGVLDDGDGSGLVSIDTLTLGSALNVGSVLATVALVLSALGVMGAMRTALRTVFGIAVLPDNPVLAKVRDLVTFLVLMLGVVVTAVGGIVTNTLGAGAAELLHLPAAVTGVGLRLAAVVVSLVVDAGVLALVVSAAGIRVPRRDLVTGSLLGAVGFGALRVVGTSAVGSVADNPVLASFAAIVVLLLWLHLAARVLLYATAWMANPPEPATAGHPDELHARERPNYVTHSVPRTLVWPHNVLTGVLEPDPTEHPDYVPPAPPREFPPPPGRTQQAGRGGRLARLLARVRGRG